MCQSGARNRAIEVCLRVARSNILPLAVFGSAVFAVKATVRKILLSACYSAVNSLISLYIVVLKQT